MAEAAGVSIDTDRLLGLRHLIEAGEPGAGSRTMMLPGGIVTRRRGRGIEIDDIRLFALGDDVRHIDRATSARTGKLHVRTFRDERERAVLLVADLRPSMFFGTRRALRAVAAAEALALAGWRIAGQGGRVGLFARAGGESVYVRPGAGDRAMRMVAGRLAATFAAAQAEAGEAEPPLADLVEAATRTLPHDATILLATALDQPGAAFRTVVRDLVHRAALDVFLVADAFELRPPPGHYPFVDPAGRAATGHVDATTASRAEAEVRRRMAEVEALGGRTLLVDASEAPAVVARQIEAFDARRR